MTRDPDELLFEVSWEVCNKVGGIYTVLRSKAHSAVQEYGENYFLLGPNLKTNREFEETDEECWRPIREAAAIKEIPCRFGRWTIPGRPRVILVEFAAKYNREQLLYRLWDQFGVDSISGGWDYIEPVMFSYACGEIIETICNLRDKTSPLRAVAQFHEWMCGAGLLRLKKYMPSVGTVFTTHATILGRALCGSGVDIYKEMEHIAPQKAAAAHNIMAKFSMEIASAREADCFTTVSEITAVEARNFLGRQPDVILPNGLDMAAIPDLAANREPALANRAKLFEFAARVLGRPIPAHTRLMIISGRYEYHNKGIDLFLEALGRLQKDALPDTSALAFLFVIGGHREINPALLPSGDAGTRLGQPPLLVTHRLHHEGGDPILEACNRLGLRNAPEGSVNVIFMPAYLDGYDGVLNMHYYDVLQACDLGVFPSFYEPWGYTPLESVAFAVPTITSDLAGFGLWARQTPGPKDGLTILERHNVDMSEAAGRLHDHLREFLQWSDAELLRRRQAARHVAANANWTSFYRHYHEAYAHARLSADKRSAQFGEALPAGARCHTFAGTASVTPHFRSFSAVVNLPEPLAQLREIAYNLWWSWNTDALELFAMLEPRLWPAMGNNPVRMLESVTPARLEEMAHNEEYLALYRHVVARFDDYMGERRTDRHSARSPHINAAAPVAYFSAEYGLHECLPLYSGGLGVLSGDHLKAASDMNIPLIAIGLLYKTGYFRQHIDRDGRQAAEYPVSDAATMPARIVRDDHGLDVGITIELPGRALHATIWEVKVGRISLYLLDTDTPRNTQQDRAITAHLYCADRRMRIEQEILLGMGGVRLLRRLSIRPSVFHINEGHSAFLILERIGALMAEEGLAFDEAREAVRGNTVFTTHTPVEAGNERFDRDIIEYYFGGFIQRTGITWPQLWELGRREPGDDKPFFMTILGLKCACGRNAVSRMHGAVSRRMWRDVWHGFHETDIPIRSITNGVHAPSFIAPRMRRLLDTYVGLTWPRTISDETLWKRLKDIPAAQFWQAKTAAKQELLDLARANLAGQPWLQAADARRGRDENPVKLNPDALLIGFARRFAPYKRALLIFKDLDRLDRLVNDPRRPIQIMFAGKAHPNDGMGIDLVRQVIGVCNDPRFRGKVVFIEDYNLRTARAMVQGVDVWLNTPMRPFEASGTSGQKAAINGTLNFSVSDGWWCEGYDGTNGWTIGPVAGEKPVFDDQTDDADANSLYSILEDEIVPLFYDRDESDLPQKWVAMMKQSIATLMPRFNTDRMMREYYTNLYKPAAERLQTLTSDNYQLARKIAEWKLKVPMRFSSVHIIDVSIEGIHGDSIPVGQPLKVHVRIAPGKLSPDELTAEMVVGQRDGDELVPPLTTVPLKARETQRNVLLFTGEFTVSGNGRYAYGIRVMPFNPILPCTQDVELVLWC